MHLRIGEVQMTETQESKPMVCSSGASSSRKMTDSRTAHTKEIIERMTSKDNNPNQSPTQSFDHIINMHLSPQKY
jgi:hypothetical protein